MKVIYLQYIIMKQPEELRISVLYYFSSILQKTEPL